MKRIRILLALGATVALMPTVSRATIIGGSHDFTSSGAYTTAGTNGVARFKWGGSPGGSDTNSFYQNPCQVCHIPHKSQAYAAAKAPLWNHKLSANTYITYDSLGSATYKGGAITLGSSIACLSCHDGSVAINQTSGASGSSTTNALNGAAMYVPSFAVETLNSGTVASGAGPYGGFNNLTQMHPIGVSYSTAVANGDSELQPVSGILTKMLKGSAQTVECASCHDIHETVGTAGTIPYDHALIQPLEGGALCLTCHKK